MLSAYTQDHLPSLTSEKLMFQKKRKKRKRRRGEEEKKKEKEKGEGENYQP